MSGRAASENGRDASGAFVMQGLRMANNYFNSAVFNSRTHKSKFVNTRNHIEIFEWNSK